MNNICWLAVVFVVLVLLLVLAQALVPADKPSDLLSGIRCIWV
jgi:hypothetical protein